MRNQPYQGPRPLTEPGQLRPWLSSLSHDELVDWVWRTAIRDRILGESLRCEAAHAAAGGFDPAALRESIARLTEIHPDTTWRESDAAGRQVEAAGDLLRRAVERGTSQDLVRICEFSLQRAEQAVMDVQDSEYWSNGVLEELRALHRRACGGSTAPPPATADGTDS